MPRPQFTTDHTRDATAAIAGFCYQVDQTILQWVNLDDDAAIVLEAGEDIDIIRALADESDADRILTQIKRLAGSLTLRSEPVVAAVAHLAGHRARNRGLSLRLSFVSTATPALERPNPFTPAASGLERWNALASRGTTDHPDLPVIQGILAHVGRPRQGVTVEDWRAFEVAIATETTLLDLVRGVRWSLGADDSDRIEAAACNALVARGLCADLAEASHAYISLFSALFRRLAGAGDKLVTSSSLRECLASRRDSMALGPRRRLIALCERLRAAEDLLIIHGNRLDAHEDELSRLAASLAADDSVGTSPADGLPSPAPYFRGRDGQVGAVSARLTAGGRVVLVGPPGIGKTQLARAVLRSADLPFRRIVWLRAQNLDTLVGDLVALGERQGLRSTESSEPEFARHVVATLSAHDMLLVYDDVASFHEIKPFLSLAGPLLATSCSDLGWTGSAITERVRELPPEASVALIADLVGDEDVEAALCLHGLLDGLPLALVQVARACVDEGLTVREMVTRIRGEGPLVLKCMEPALDYPTGFAEALALRRDSLCRAHPDAGLLLGVIVALAPAGIPRSLLIAIPESSTVPTLDSLLSDRARVDSALRAIRAAGLCEIHAGQTSVHGLVRGTLLSLMSQEEQDVARGVALLLAANGLKTAVRARDVVRSNDVFPHVLVGLLCAEPKDLAHEVVTELGNHAVDHLEAWGRYDVALQLASRLSDLHCSAFGPANFWTLFFRNKVGVLLQKSHDFEQAAVVFRDLVADCENALGNSHHLTQRARFNLGFVLSPLDQEGAPDSLENAVVFRRAHGSPEEVATALSGLGNYWILRQPERAVPYFRESLDIRRERCAHDSVEFILVCCNLGSALLTCGEVDEADLVLREAEGNAHLVLRRHHPVCVGLHQLRMGICAATGDTEGAIAAGERAVAAAERSHRGADGLEYLATLEAFAECCEGLDLWPRAEAIRRAARDHDVSPRSLGHVWRAARGLANVLRVLGRPDEGWTALAGGLAMVKEHAEIEVFADALMGTARSFYEHGELEWAERLYRWVLAFETERSGAGSVSVAFWTNGLATVLLRRSRRADAVPLLRAALASLETADTPEIGWSVLAQVRINLGTVAYQDGELAIAKREFESVIAVLRRPGYPGVAEQMEGIARLGLAHALSDSGDPTGAGREASMAHPLLLDAFGEGHPMVHDAAALAIGNMRHQGAK